MSKSNTSGVLPSPKWNKVGDLIKLIEGNGRGGSPTQPTSTHTGTGSIAQIPNTKPSDDSATETSEKARENFDKDAEDEMLGVHAGRQQAVDSSYTDNPEEWARRYPYWNWNLAKDSPRGNLNGMAFKDTRLMSRLADALNNERHLKPTDIGMRTLNYGATGTGADNAGSERWEPIETQEMRQMRADERLDEKARGYDVDRQKSIEDYPLEFRKQVDKFIMEMNKYATQTGIDLERLMQRGIFDAEYVQRWSTYWATVQNRFAQELGLDIKERVFSKLASMENYPLKQMYGYFMRGVQVPSPITEDFWNMAQNLVRNEKDPTTKVYLYQTLFSIASMWGVGAVKSAASGVFGEL